ncbi:MAG: MBL fold metallo-hydrolase [Pseudomonadota bacterium]
MNAPVAVIHHPWEEPPIPGNMVEVAEGVLWARLPLPMKLDHVNIYALDDGDGWTLIDTGLNWAKGRAALDALIEGPLGGKPVHRVLMTHHHPDHIGLVGRFADKGVPILASRVAWLLGRMLTLDRQEMHPPQAITYRQRAGVTGAALDDFRAEAPFNFADCVAPIPLGFQVLEAGDQFSAGGRDWTIRLGHGHAPHHVTLWSEDILLAGDQVIPGISPNIGVYPTEPEADPMGGWLDTCRRFRALDADPLVLPGHKLPFRGLNFRLDQLIENHLSAFDRIMSALGQGPLTAVGMMPAIFKREVESSQFGLALVEAVAHANYLHQSGQISRRLTADGAWVYERA